MTESGAGAMLAVMESEQWVAQLLAEPRQSGCNELEIAAVNTARQCVVSGEAELIAELERRLWDRGVGSKRLAVNHAFHSRKMDSVLERFGEEVRKVKLSEPRISYISNVTGDWVRAEDATSWQYWVRQMREVVRFSAGVEQLIKQEGMVMVEVGPGDGLSRMVRESDRPRRGGAQAGVTPRTEEGGNARGTHHVVVATLGKAEEGREVESAMGALGEVWVNGVEVDWEEGYEKEKRMRVELPSYPFERERYWVERRNTAEASHREQGTGQRREIEDWFYAPVWRRSAGPASKTRISIEEKEASEAVSWLVFMDEAGIGTGVVAALEQRGEDVVRVTAGEKLSQLGEREYELGIGNREEYEELLGELRGRGWQAQRVLHLWGVKRERGDERSASRGAAVEEAQMSGLYSLMYLAQALGKQLIEQAFAQQSEMSKIEIEVVTNSMREVNGEEELRPEKATVLGACLVIPQEYSGITCRSIDIELTEAGSRHELRLIEQLIAEFDAASVEAAVAYRGRHRWLERFEALRLPATPSLPVRLRPGGVYLMTGGLGGVALELSTYLARTVQAKLVLVGRSELPERTQWEQWLKSHDSADRTSRRIRKVRELEDLGAEVLVLQADVCEEEQMREVVREARKRFYRIDGVIHSAGLPPAGLIQLKTPEMAAGVLAPKVKGTLILDRVLKDTKLDFMILNSSVRSYLGLPGGIDYTAANAFLDAFAHYRTMTQPDQLTVSINWDGWEETGMGVESRSRLNTVEREVGIQEILSREGVDVFSRILGAALPQVVVSVHDFASRLAQHNARAATDHLEVLKRAHLARIEHPRPALETPYVAPRNEVERIIAEIWQDLLGIEKVGVHDNFFELGGDSVITLQVTAKVNRAGLGLTPRLVFEHQTIDGLAKAAGTMNKILAEQGLTVGPLPLTPVQRWFFERELPQSHHFNQAILLEVHEPLAPGTLEQSLSYLLIQHDALRLRFRRGANSEGDVQQLNADFDGLSPFSATDLSSLAEHHQKLAIETIAAETQASLSLSEGPLIRVVLFDLGPQSPGRLLIVIHHLAVDGVSWRILLEDLQTTYRQLSRGEAVTLPPKTTSFKYWAERLAEHAQSRALQDELIYWGAETRTHAGRLSVDHPLGINSEASVKTVSLSLSAQETRSLLQEVPSVYRTQINDILLTALAQALRRSTGDSALIVDLEGHGREAIFNDVDVSRTVGWFTTIFPVLLELEEGAGPGAALRSIKEQLRAVPNHGMGYGLLRYLSGDNEVYEKLCPLPAADVSFLYLGQLDQTMSQVEMFGAATESSGPTCNPDSTRSHLLEVSGLIVGGCLKLDWGYSENLHERSSIENLARAFMDALSALILHCQSPEAGGYTPSDFVEAGLNQDDLDELVAQLGTS